MTHTVALRVVGTSKDPIFGKRVIAAVHNADSVTGLRIRNSTRTAYDDHIIELEADSSASSLVEAEHDVTAGLRRVPGLITVACYPAERNAHVQGQA